MTDDEMKIILEQADAPDLDDAARERIVTSSAIRYRHAARKTEINSTASSGGWLKNALTPLMAAAATLVLVVAIQQTLPGGNTNGFEVVGTDRYSAAVFDEYRSLFQDDLRAVVARNGDIDVVLGGEASQQANPLVLIRIEVDGQPTYITAYSGQTIEAEIGGKSVTLDILTTTDQEVVLASDEFMLENNILHGPDGFVANAHVLEISL